MPVQADLGGDDPILQIKVLRHTSSKKPIGAPMLESDHFGTFIGFGKCETLIANFNMDLFE
jgi:hypothetical protein